MTIDFRRQTNCTGVQPAPDAQGSRSTRPCSATAPRTPRSWRLWPGILCILLAPSLLFAAGHHEITVVPLGPGYAPQGQSIQSFRLPAGPAGPHPQPLVLIASQPQMAVPLPAPLAPDTLTGEEEEHMELVPATIHITVAGKKLPPWELFEFPTAFIINLDTIRANPDFAKGRVAITFEVQSNAPGVNLRACGMPDPLLVNESLDGPLALFHQSAQKDEVRAYLEALAHELAGNKEQARRVYRQLASSNDSHLARLARRGLRTISHDLRPHQLSGNFREHYRWGLYLQQVGIFSPAYKEFDEARIIYNMHADALYRTGETLDQIEGDVFRVMDFMDRAAAAAWEPNPARWSALIVILKEKHQRRLSADELLQIKVSWLITRSMVWGATAGKILPVGTVLEIENDASWSMIDYGDGLIAPSRDIVAQRGWFDSVFFVRPRTDKDIGPAIRTVGGDEGPNGAALSALYHDGDWRTFMVAWYHHFTWAAKYGEVDNAFPLADEITDCGYPPVPNLAYASRAALRYHYSPEVLRRVQMTPRPGPKEFVHLWRLDGPFPASSIRADENEANGRLLAPLPDPHDNQSRSFISRTDYIKLDRLFPDAGPAIVRATCWVYSPEDQEVRMWLGRNDGAAVWINNRLIHSGRQYATGEYRDRDLVDTVASFAPLKSGWNEVRVVVESLSDPDNRGWGFSLRFCDLRNQPVPGLAYLNRPPAGEMAPSFAPPPAGPHYAWDTVRREWSERLPTLTDNDLRRITGVNDLTLSGSAGPGGHVLLAAGPSGQSGRYRPMPGPWRPGEDRDVELNNLMDWDREACAALRYERDGSPRDLLLVKPEALIAYMTLLKEPAAAANVFDGKSPDQRLLGCVIVPTADSARRLFVIDCLLSEAGGWPLDEEDLLEPIAAEYSPNPPRLLPPYTPAE